MDIDIRIFTLTDEDNLGRLSKCYRLYISGLLKYEYKTYPSTQVGATCLRYTYHYSGTDLVACYADLSTWTQVMEDTSSGIGYNSKSIHFDGVNDYLSVPNTVGTYDVDVPFSMCFWVKPDASGEGNNRTLYYSGGDNNHGIRLEITGNNEIKITSETDAGGRNKTFKTTLLTSEAWNHVVITYGGSGVFTGCYVNGVKDVEILDGVVGSNADTGRVVYIGRADNGRYLVGSLDEITFWSTELSQSDATNLYNGGVPNDISVLPDYVDFCDNHYRMGDNDIFPTIADNKGTDNLTMVNMDAGDIEDEVPE